MVGEGGEDVRRMRRSEGVVMVISVMVEDDGGEWNELGGALGDLQLRRRAAMLVAAA